MTVRRVVSVVGARPQFVKLAPVAQALMARCDHVIVHTGQHYDARLSDIFFEDLAIPSPNVHLGIGSGPHGAQTGAMLSALEAVFLTERPDWVLVYGDTNSTLAATLAAVKMRLPVAHLEAGLRSFNRTMPEEHNRVLTDHAADLLLAPTQNAVALLANEGLSDRTVHVGDVMTDVCLAVRDEVAGDPVPFEVDGEFLLATIHRAENTDDPERLASILGSIASLDRQVVLAAHPRLVAKASEFGLKLDRGVVRVVAPLAYPQLIRALLASSGVVTDSGGLQKEAFLLERICTTIRTETEWVETLEGGWNRLCSDLRNLAVLVRRPEPAAVAGAPYGRGDAAALVADALLGARLA